MLYGTGKYTYELVDGWAKIPEGWSFVDVCGLSIDSQDRKRWDISSGSHNTKSFDKS